MDQKTLHADTPANNTCSNCTYVAECWECQRASSAPLEGMRRAIGVVDAVGGMLLHQEIRELYNSDLAHILDLAVNELRLCHHCLEAAPRD